MLKRESVNVQKRVVNKKIVTAGVYLREGISQ